MTVGTLMEIDGYTWSGVRLTRKPTTSRPDNVWPDMSKHMSDASKRKAKRRWAIEKPKLDNARRLRGIYFIDPYDEEFKDIMKNARRKLEIPMPAAMPCKTPVNCRGEACRTRQNTLVLLRTTNLWENAWKDVLTRIMKIILQEKGWIHWVTLIWCTNLFLCLEQWKYQMQRQQWRKKGKNSRKYRHGSWRRSETNSEKYILRRQWISVISRVRSWSHRFKNTKVESYSEVTLWKMIQDRMQYSPIKDHQHHKWRLQKWWIL